MIIPTIDIPEPFQSAFAEGAAKRVTDAEVTTPAARWARGMARVLVGRENEARADFESCANELGDVCGIELAFLDLRQRSAVREVGKAARLIVERAPRGSMLQGRALHVLGLAEGKIRRTPEAVDSLLRAAEIYRDAGNLAGRAQVYDTIGNVEAARGRLDFAIQYLAISLVDKTLLGDRFGIAITLGNIGRVHLRLGRFRDAIECFERDLRLSKELGDARGEARMHEDLGRAYLGMESLEKAEAEFAQCIALAQPAGMNDLVFFAHKDLVLTRLSQGRIDDAEVELARAQATAPPNAEPYFGLILENARGDVMQVRKDPKAIELLESAVRGFEKAQLPDLEIPARISLARALIDAKLKSTAEQCLLKGLKIARADGYARYLAPLNEAMNRLDLVEGAIDETNRAIVEKATTETTSTVPSTNVAYDSYVIRSRLGEGAFGEVFRVYDSQRGHDVALKRLHLETLYDVKQRQKLVASAKLELEAASRVRHPGVCRVYACGTQSDGGIYVVQEFVAGKPMRALMPIDAAGSVAEGLRYVERIAHALQALHGVGVVHRDLKPENILVKEGQWPVLVDFGIAHVAAMSGEKAPQIAGTMAYMSPEQAGGAKVIDGRADLYALGVILYEWLSGVRPLRPRGADLEAMLKDIVKRTPPPIGDFRSDLGEDVKELVNALLSKKPKHRPESAQEVAGMCQKILKGVPETRKGSGSPDPAKKPESVDANAATSPMDLPATMRD